MSKQTSSTNGQEAHASAPEGRRREPTAPRSFDVMRSVLDEASYVAPKPKGAQLVIIDPAPIRYELVE